MVETKENPTTTAKEVLAKLKKDGITQGECVSLLLQIDPSERTVIIMESFWRTLPDPACLSILQAISPEMACRSGIIARNILTRRCINTGCIEQFFSSISTPAQSQPIQPETSWSQRLKKWLSSSKL